MQDGRGIRAIRDRKKIWPSDPATCPTSRLITGHKYPDPGASPLTRAPGPVTSRGLRQRLRLCDICQHAQTGGGGLSAFFGEMVEEEIVMLTAFMEIDRRQHG